jgi:hypothetical protein
MTTATRIRIAVALLLFAGVFTLQQSPNALEAVSAAIQSPLELFGYKSKVVQAWIVEESSDRPKLDQQQIIAIRKAETLGIKLVDPQDQPVDAKAKAELEAVLKAVQGKSLPQLVRKWSNGRTTAIACPGTFEKLREAVQ